MNNNLTEMIFILDRSGSMSSLEDDTIGGFNSLIKQQKNEEGKARVTTVLFDDKIETLHDNLEIENISEIDNASYFARGMTALYDAIGITINNIGERLSKTDEKERPKKVVVVITTDGFENASKEFNKAQVKELIEHQQEKYNWTFMFLGANMDAAQEASSIGIDSSFARTYTASDWGTQSVYMSVSKSMSLSRDASLSSQEVSEKITTVLDGVQ